MIGVCGGSASGKTTVANKIISELGVPWVTLLSMDSFYKVLNEKQHEQAALNEYNFDHPDAFDFDLLLKTLKRLKEMKKVEVPIYNFVTHRRESKTVSMYGANVIIFEGILAFHMEEIRDILDMKMLHMSESNRWVNMESWVLGGRVSMRPMENQASTVLSHLLSSVMPLEAFSNSGFATATSLTLPLAAPSSPPVL